MRNSDTEASTAETVTKSEIGSFCRHMGRALKGRGASDSALAMHLMQESAYLEKNGFDKVAEMFRTVATTLDPSLPIKMEHVRKQQADQTNQAD